MENQIKEMPGEKQSFMAAGKPKSQKSKEFKQFSIQE